ncbi:MAG: hydroxymethylglutaryl-CoA synthase, partial [Polyangiaceae bacterium]
MTQVDGLPGVSAMSLYVPRLRVPLDQWCAWTGNNWDKVRAVVGHSFRVCGRHENVYTMAANAVLRLILQNQIDPQQVGSLGLGTESSTDNAAGAVIVRGMVDGALDKLGMPRLSRQLEVPEFKHACLGGVYALKNALRYVSYDGRDRLAIVVSADVAEYERGSSGEQ